MKTCVVSEINTGSYDFIFPLKQLTYKNQFPANHLKKLHIYFNDSTPSKSIFTLSKNRNIFIRIDNKTVCGHDVNYALLDIKRCRRPMSPISCPHRSAFHVSVCKQKRYLGHFYLGHFYLGAFLPWAFLPWGIFTWGIITGGDFTGGIFTGGIIT